MEFFGDRFKDFAVDIDDLAVELNDDIDNLYYPHSVYEYRYEI